MNRYAVAFKSQVYRFSVSSSGTSAVIMNTELRSFAAHFFYRTFNFECGLNNDFVVRIAHAHI